MPVALASGLPYLFVNQHFVSNVDTRQQGIIIFHHISSLGFHHLSPVRHSQSFFLEFGLDYGQLIRKVAAIDCSECSPGENGQCFFHHSYILTNNLYFYIENTFWIQLKCSLAVEDIEFAIIVFVFCYILCVGISYTFWCIIDLRELSEIPIIHSLWSYK
jgi:hypothetical protein